MIVTGKIRKGAYFDSITLMRCGKEIAAMKGIVDAAVVMGTRSNKAILSSSGLAVPLFDDAGEADLLIVVKSGNREAADSALAAACRAVRVGGVHWRKGPGWPFNLSR